MSRFRAAGIHFLLSILIVLTVLALMLGLWYPGAYFKLMGGGKLIFLIFATQVTIGPLLTLIIYKTDKKQLVFDLMIIAALQISSLVYGGYAMFQARPVFNVFVGDVFQIASANDIERTDLLYAPEMKWRYYPLMGPLILGSKEPDDVKFAEQITFARKFGAGKHQIPKLYIDYNKSRGKVLDRAIALSKLRALNIKNANAIDRYLNRENLIIDNLVFLPVISKFAAMVIVLEASSGNFLEILDINPYAQQ